METGTVALIKIAFPLPVCCCPYHKQWLTIAIIIDFFFFLLSSNKLINGNDPYVYLTKVDWCDFLSGGKDTSLP